MIRRAFFSMIGGFSFMSLFRIATKSKPDSDVVMEAIGQASMCWEYPCRAGVFDSSQALEIGNRLRQHYADGIGDFATARRRVCDDMATDEGLRIGYHANIAMAIYDSCELGCELNIDDCNRIANRIMHVVFEIDMDRDRMLANV